MDSSQNEQQGSLAACRFGAFPSLICACWITMGAQLDTRGSERKRHPEYAPRETEHAQMKEKKAPKGWSEKNERKKQNYKLVPKVR